MENYIVINGKKTELTKEQLEVLGIKTNENPFNRVEHGNLFYHIGPDGKIHKSYECKNRAIRIYDDYYAAANYCIDEKLLKQRALHETFSRLLWRFSCENGELENEWNDNNFHYSIYWDKKYNKINISFSNSRKLEGLIYFPSYAIAKRAVKEIVEPFIKEHPDFVW